MGEARVLIQGMVGVTADESQDGLSRSEREREIACRVPKTSKWVGCGWRLCGTNGWWLIIAAAHTRRRSCHENVNTA
jgi:hypothetical protein